MKVYVNDKPVEVPPGTVLNELLKAAGRSPELSLVEVGGRFVPRFEYKSCALREGDRVTVRELLGGG